MSKPITFNEAVSTSKTVSPQGAAIEIREFKLSGAGRAALSGQSVLQRSPDGKIMSVDTASPKPSNQ